MDLPIITLPSRKKIRKRKKRKCPKRTPKPKTPFHVYIMKGKIQVKKVGEYHSLNDALTEMRDLSDKSVRTVLFPMSSKIKSTFYKSIRCEIVVLKEGNDGKPAMLQDELGCFVEHRAVSESGKKYTFIAKMPYNIEERFTVYGESGKKYRAEYKDILKAVKECENLPRGEYARVMAFRRFLMVDMRTYGHFAVKCRTEEDCFRLHDKLKYDIRRADENGVLFLGAENDENTSRWLDLLKTMVTTDESNLLLVPKAIIG